MTLREVLLKEIEDLERDLKARKKMLRDLDANERRNESSDARFKGVRPIVAIRRVIREHGPMEQDKLTEILIAGGITEGKKRSHHNVRIAIEVSEKVGSLIIKDGIVSLPDNDTDNDD